MFEKIHGSSLLSWKKLTFEAMFHCGELKLQPDSILTMITLHLGRCHIPCVAFMVPGHPLTASTADRPSGWVLWTTGTDVAAKLLAKNRKQMPCTRANHRLFVVLFSPVSHFWQWWETGDFRESARNLRATGNCNKISITELTQGIISHKVTTREKASENA